MFNVFQIFISDMIYFILDFDSRVGSVCIFISNQFNVEDIIQWKKGNVFGKGVFGVVSVLLIMYKRVIL